MNVKNYLTVSGVLGILYGLFFFLGTDQVAEMYQNTELANSLAKLMFKFFGISILASGIMAIMARNASRSIGRTAILYYMAVSQILFLIMNLVQLGNESSVTTTNNYIDLVVNLILGAGALYFILKDRSATE